MNRYNLTWLMEWYSNQCDGDWEHSYGIKIETIDNPGWSITIDMQGTDYNQIKDKPWQLVELDGNNWYGYKVQDGKFEASGDPTSPHLCLKSNLPH